MTKIGNHINLKFAKMKKIVSLIMLWVVSIGMLHADNVEFTANAPDVVISGEQFRLTFTVNTMKVKDFRAPSITDFEVLMGPSRSQQTSTQIINGNVSSSSSLTYTYVLSAQKEGTFTIPGAVIKVDGEEYKSNSVTVKVLPPDQSNGIGGRGTSQQGNSSSSASSNISNKDLFMTATVNKTKVHEQEAILLTYKIYTVLNLTELQGGKMPDLKGFHTQEVSLPRNKTFSLEHYQGRNYRTLVWSQYVLFPQQTGKLEIPSITYTGIIEQPNRNIDPFDAFFNGGSAYVSIRKQIVTPKVSIEVVPLPTNKPESFGGAVGDFSLTSSINSKTVKTGDAVTVKIVLSGTGNMKLIDTPEVKFPSDFEVYDPKVDNKFSLTQSGLTGNKVFEYLAIPRHAGKYTIPGVEFTYFDLNSNTYKTLKTESYEVNVDKGKGDASQVLANFTNKEDVKHLGKDILYIKLGDTTLKQKDEFLFGSLSYYLWYVIPFACFVGLIIVGRKQALENSNAAKMRTKKANKIATKRMKLAKQLLDKNQKNEFYDEVLKALWGYISDKLNIPVSELSKDNIDYELKKSSISEELIKEFINLLNDCEFARYAPGDVTSAMDKIYSSAIAMISKIEDSFKH